MKFAIVWPEHCVADDGVLEESDDNRCAWELNRFRLRGPTRPGCRRAGEL